MGVDIIDQFLPDHPVKEVSVFYGIFYQAGTLLKNPAAPDGIVANFAIAHILIRGHAHRCSMCFQL